MIAGWYGPDASGRWHYLAAGARALCTARLEKRAQRLSLGLSEPFFGRLCPKCLAIGRSIAEEFFGG